MFNLPLSVLEEKGAQITTQEIKQQPELWLETVELYRKIKNDIQLFLETIHKKHGKVSVIFTGAGTSEYVGNTLLPYVLKNGDREKYTFSSVATTDLVSAPYDFLFEDEPVVLVSFARSGNSPESVAAVELADHICKHAYHLFITCAPNGKLALMAENKNNAKLFLMPSASNDAGFAMTGSFTCMLLAATLVFDTTPLNEKEAYVKASATGGLEVIQRVSEIETIATKDFNRIVYLGSGSLAGLAREAQLKILELTAGKIATNYDSSMGFRHGPKSFVNDKTLVCVFVHNHPYTRLYDMDILNEIYGDGITKHVFAIGQNIAFAGDKFSLDQQDILLPDVYLALVDIMVAQTIAVLSAFKCDNKPDTPSPSGTVNRVVKGVVIHPYE